MMAIEDGIEVLYTLHREVEVGFITSDNSNTLIEGRASANWAFQGQ